MEIKFNLACSFNRCWRSIPGYGEWINQQKRGLNCTLWICSGHQKMITQFWRSVVSSLIIELSGSTEGLHFLWNLTVTRLFKNSVPFMVPEGSLPHTPHTAMCTLSQPRWIQAAPSYPVSLRSISVLFFHLHVGIWKGFFASVFPIKTH